MGDRRADTSLRDIDALFRLGVVSELTDGQLLERFASHSEIDGQMAFEAIVRRHGPMVLGVCRRVLGDHHSSEDAFQATFMVLAIKSRAIRKGESLGPWLHGVAARIARRKLAGRRRVRREPIALAGRVDLVDRAPATVDADIHAVLDEELGRLPDKYRLPLVLCYLEGQTQDEAARALGWTKGTVSGRLARAKDLLKHRLTRRGMAPTAGLLTSTLVAPSARASLPGSLVVPTVRAAAAAVLGSAETALVSGSVATLVKETLKVMMLGRLGRTAAQLGLLAIGTAAMAMPFFRPTAPTLAHNRAGDRRVFSVAATALDANGDPLPAGALLRLGTTRRRHSRAVAGIAFAPDGAAAVTAQDDGVVRFWDRGSGKVVSTIDMLAGAATHDKRVRDFAVSADGTLMAAAGFALDPVSRRVVHRVWIHDLKRSLDRPAIVIPTVDLLSLAFAPDGATLATGSFGGIVELWDVATGSPRGRFTLGLAAIDYLSFAPEGKVLAICEQGKGVRLWNLEERQETFLAEARSRSTAPLFSADGRWMAINLLGDEVALWDRATGQRQRGVDGVALAFSPDSRTLALAGSAGGTIKVIDMATGGDLWSVTLGWGPQTARVAFAPDGTELIAEQEGALRFFLSSSGRERLGNPESHHGAVTNVGFTPDGRILVTASDDGTVREWDRATARPMRIMQQGGRIRSLAVSLDGTSFAVAADQPEGSVSVTVWSLATGERRQHWSDPGAGAVGGAIALAFSEDGNRLLSFDPDRGLRSLNIASGDEGELEQPELGLEGSRLFASGLRVGVFAPGNRFLALAGSTMVSVIDLASGRQYLNAPGQAVALGPLGQSVAIATTARPELSSLGDGSIRVLGPGADRIDVIDLATSKSRRIGISTDLVTSLAVSPDGRLVAAAGGWVEPTIRLYRIADGRQTATFACPARVGHAGALAFAPDGRSLAAGFDDSTVLLWDTRDVR
jgi:RNA polymerase sigma factor (sigma-70 family)